MGCDIHLRIEQRAPQDGVRSYEVRETLQVGPAKPSPLPGDNLLQTGVTKKPLYYGEPTGTVVFILSDLSQIICEQYGVVKARYHQVQGSAGYQEIANLRSSKMDARDVSVLGRRYVLIPLHLPNNRRTEGYTLQPIRTGMELHYIRDM